MKKKIIYTTDQELGKEVWFLTLEDKKERLIYRTSDQNEINLLEWDPPSRKILITLSTPKGIKKYLILNTENPEKIDIYNTLGDFYFQFKNIKENKLLLADYDLIESSNKFITLIDRKKQSLVILNPANNETIFEAEAYGGSWFPDGQKLLYFNDFELWVYDLTLDEKKLITRYSQKILDAKWYLNDNYVLLLANNSIKALEIDQRDIRNVTDLAKMDEIYEFEVNKKKKKYIFLEKLERGQGSMN